VKQLAPHRPFYYIWGGEPFLYPDILKLTAAIKENRSLLALVTNATFLEANAEAVVDQGWDALMFSLDGPEALHDEIRGRKGTSKKVRAGIDGVKRRKKETGRSVPWLMPLITVSTWNADRLDDIVRVASELGADAAVIYYSWFTNEAVGKTHTRVFENRLGITPTAWRGYLFNHQVDTLALKESLARIRARKHPFPILYVPALGDDQLDRYYGNPADFMGYGPCISPWTTVEIMPNGDVATCRDYPDYIAGNILDAPMEAIWNGDRYVTFRKALSENGGTFPICARCCGLMGW
jgi:radical SAM protein with 4Fe4S-binding SPASM domain